MHIVVEGRENFVNWELTNDSVYENVKCRCKVKLVTFIFVLLISDCAPMRTTSQYCKLILPWPLVTRTDKEYKMMYSLKHTQRLTIYIFIIQLTVIRTTSSRQNSQAHQRECIESANTVEEVPNCPENKQDWEKQALLKSCHLVTQNCSSNETFQYHCLIEETTTKLLEMCAPTYQIKGRLCAEFNTIANVVQGQYGASCSNCPFSYNSNTSYTYQECYGLVKKSTTPQTSTAKKYNHVSHGNVSKTQAGNSSKRISSSLSIGPILLIVLALIHH